MEAGGVIVADLSNNASAFPKAVKLQPQPACGGLRFERAVLGVLVALLSKTSRAGSTSSTSISSTTT